jgi:acetyl esterase/lipase
MPAASLTFFIRKRWRMPLFLTAKPEFSGSSWLSWYVSAMKHLWIGFLFLALPAVGLAQTVIPLYGSDPAEIPNARPVPDSESSDTSGQDHILRVSKVSRPTLTVFPAARPNGTGIIICPGGGYSILAAGHEGYEVARQLNVFGITAFVLKYRIPSDETMYQKEIGPLQDAQRAIQMVRESAANWHIDPARLGIMGFSAGGHLASTAGTHFEKPVIPEITGISLRPSFLILVYPVISLRDSIGHRGSRDNLLGKNPSPDTILYYSNERQVTAATPPTMLIHAKDDAVVPVENSILFYEALRRKGVSAEIYLYEHGGHGFGLHNRSSQVQWIDLVDSWLQKNGWLGAK